MKVSLSTYFQYNKLINGYNSLYPEEATSFPEVIHRAVSDLLDHSNELAGFEKVTYGKMKTINCLLAKDLYAQCQRLASKLDCSYDEVVNYALARYYAFFAVDIKKRIVYRSWDKSRVAIVLTLLDVCITKDRGDFFLIAECPKCSHEDFAVYSNGAGFCVACDEQVPLLDIVIDRKNGYPEAVNWIYEQIITNYQENFQKIDVEITPREKKGREKGFVNDVLLRDLLERSYEGSPYLEEMYGFSHEILAKLVKTRDDSPSGYAESNEFMDRVLFLIKDEKGNLVGIEGRSIYDDDKARRTALMKNPSLKKICGDFFFSETHKKKFDKLSKKSISTTGYRKGLHLYLLDQFMDFETRKAVLQVVVVEGAKDALRVYSSIMQAKTKAIAVVGLLGSNLTDEQIFLIRKSFGDKAEFIIAFDQDNPGFAKSEKTKNKLKNYRVRYALYPSGYKDFGQMEDLQEVLQTIQQAVGYDEYFEVMIARGYEPEIKRPERKPEEKEDRGQRLRRQLIAMAAEIFQEKRQQKQLRESQQVPLFSADAIPF